MPETIDAAITLTPRFNLGDTVWVAEASSYAAITVPCPICFGKRRVILILGDGSMCDIECDVCEKYGPKGTVAEHGVTSSVRSATVTDVRIENGRVRCAVEHSSNDEDFFPTREEAEARRIVLYAAAEAQAAKNQEQILLTHKKKHSWTAHHHLEQAKKARKTAEYHESKAKMIRAEATTNT